MSFKINFKQNILFAEDTLNQLQCLRESVAHMKNTTLQNTALGGIGSTVCSFVVIDT